MEPVETPPSDATRSRGRLNSTIVATGAAVALTLAGLGIAGAQTGSSPTTPGTAAPAAGGQSDKPAGVARHHGPGKGRHPGLKIGLSVAAKAIGISQADLKAALRSGQSVADVAKSNNVEVQKVIDALVAEAKKKLAEKVTAGDLTQARVDQRSANLRERITAFVNHDGPRPGGHKRRGRGHRPGAKVTLAVAAKTIGVSEADLMTARRSGQSVADVAKSNNVEVQKVIDALVADVEKHLSEKVAAGELTQARADERSANLAERVTALVNQARPGPGGHRRLGRPEGAVGSQQAPAGEGRGSRRADPGRPRLRR